MSGSTLGSVRSNEPVAIDLLVRGRTVSRPRYPAIKMLRKFPDVPIGDPLRTAAMFEARARDSLADAHGEERAGRLESAAVFLHQHDEDLLLAQQVIETAVSAEPANAA
jgi:hypothetical protein